MQEAQQTAELLAAVLRPEPSSFDAPITLAGDPPHSAGDASASEASAVVLAEACGTGPGVPRMLRAVGQVRLLTVFLHGLLVL